MVYGDAGYQGITKRPEMASHSAVFRVAMRPIKRRALPDTPARRLQDLIEVAKARVRAKVERPFRVIKQPFGFEKTRLRGLFQESLQDQCDSRTDQSLSRSWPSNGCSMTTELV